jgi:hypothetical protein
MGSYFFKAFRRAVGLAKTCLSSNSKRDECVDDTPLRPQAGSRRPVMATLRIYDLEQGALALDLRHILDLLGGGAGSAVWTVSAVPCARGEQAFDATGPGGEQLERAALSGLPVSGRELCAMAKETRQVIWGAFAAASPDTPGEAWLTIRAIDSTFWEITTRDETVLNAVRLAFADVREASGPFA